MHEFAHDFCRYKTGFLENWNFYRDGDSTYVDVINKKKRFDYTGSFEWNSFMDFLFILFVFNALKTSINDWINWNIRSASNDFFFVGTFLHIYFAKSILLGWKIENFLNLTHQVPSCIPRSFLAYLTCIFYLPKPFLILLIILTKKTDQIDANSRKSLMWMISTSLLLSTFILWREREY